MKIKEGGVMEVKQLEPMEIVRSEMGTWTHPVATKKVEPYTPSEIVKGAS